MFRVEPLTLYTFPISHFCEKARWALDHAEVPYREVHLWPGWNRPRLQRWGARGQVPVLADGTQVIDGSSAILDHMDRIGSDAPLSPAADSAHAEALEWESFLDQEVGITLRRIFYSHALKNPGRLIRAWSAGLPPYAAWVYRLIQKRAAAMLQQGLSITPDNVRRDHERLQRAWQRLDDTLASRRYLVGDRFGRADLTLAALSAPLLRPAEHPWYGRGAGKGIVELPEELVQLAASASASTTGQRALEHYAKHRIRPVAARVSARGPALPWSTRVVASASESRSTPPSCLQTMRPGKIDADGRGRRLQAELGRGRA